METSRITRSPAKLNRTCMYARLRLKLLSLRSTTKVQLSQQLSLKKTDLHAQNHTISKMFDIVIEGKRISERVQYDYTFKIMTPSCFSPTAQRWKKRTKSRSVKWPMTHWIQITSYVAGCGVKDWKQTFRGQKSSTQLIFVSALAVQRW
jgi:hypothetical protein